MLERYIPVLSRLTDLTDAVTKALLSALLSRNRKWGPQEQKVGVTISQKVRRPIHYDSIYPYRYFRYIEVGLSSVITVRPNDY